MKRLAAFLLGSWAKAAYAGMLLTHVGGAGGPGVTYVGPGDKVSGALFWYGLRGYSAAYSIGSNPAIDIDAPSTFTINILTSGDLDIATALSDAGTTGTGSCTIASTTITCATVTASGFSQYGNITGAGLTYPVFITSAGGCATNGCTATLNQAQTVSVAETMTGYSPMHIRKWYDQSGGSNCSGACNQGPQASASVYLIQKVVGNLPCGYFVSNTYNAATLTSTNTPVTYSIVGRRIGSFTSFGVVLDISNGSSDIQAFWNNSANQVSASAASQLNATASDSGIHAMQFVLNGASSVINVDGTETTGTVGAGTAGTQLRLGRNVAGSNLPSQYICEAGGWAAAESSGNRTLLCHNQFAYWATAASC